MMKILLSAHPVPLTAQPMPPHGAPCLHRRAHRVWKWDPPPLSEQRSPELDGNDALRCLDKGRGLCPSSSPDLTQEPPCTSLT